MKKLAVMGVAGVMAFVLSSCFSLTGFVLLDASLAPGQSTKARFTVQPSSTTSSKYVQFFLVGNDSTDDLSVGKGTWGTNDKFGGPETMSNEAGLAAALDGSDDCVSGGLDFGAVYPNFTWKGYTTVRAISDKGKVSQKSVVDINVKVKAGADTDVPVTVMGITGMWDDTDDNGNIDPTDAFQCSGNATTSLYIT